ncbi:NAD-dependent malic enzyme [Streptomyces sp. ME02-6979.5a]|uniref:NAD(P)-dependent malic enzyme n=1 Tax=Streptomyces sp. ME02-6979.5a TaxID=462925 RepID=UPI0029A56BAC|nr:malic enzyme-like NAD(P)-binding protein [Streptomyces sp. ME02-6979.5a]MDX3339689.1 NAD-dependent malic enzyme [Streptomyces sp. ME02-6979.5a]
MLKTFEHGLIGTAIRRPRLIESDLAALSTPGTALVSSAIHRDPRLFEHYSWAPRLVAVVSDGSAVLGLGDVGPRACLPVLETKCAFFKRIADLDAIPLVFSDRRIDAIVAALAALRPSFGAVSIEDVAAPGCFELERRLRRALDCPVMHNDQHGTAVAVVAALRNAALLTGRDFAAMRVVILGAGAAGIATARLLATAGLPDLTLVDTHGIVSAQRRNLTAAKREATTYTNLRGLTGGLEDALRDADALVGLSRATVAGTLLAGMCPKPIILSLANPVPEVAQEAARSVGAVYATGLATAPNCVTNLLSVPGIFHGALNAGAAQITPEMLLAAVDGLVQASLPMLDADHLVPDTLDPAVFSHISAAVGAAATVS